jgi:hypothetical protein
MTEKHQKNNESKIFLRILGTLEQTKMAWNKGANDNTGLTDYSPDNPAFESLMLISSLFILFYSSA